MGVPKKKTGGKKKPARAPQQLSASEHFENAEMAFVMENFDLARTSFKRALDMEPENVEFLEGYGSFLAETGARAEATAVLQKAAQLDPEDGFEKFMYLGQLLEGAEAEQCVRKGIAILRQAIQEQAAEPAPEAGSIEAAEAAATKEHLDATLAAALCSLAELLTNSAARAAEGGSGGGEALAAAAPECEALLGEAAAVCPGSPEPLQGLASLRKEQGKEEEALALLRQSLALWFKPSPPSDDDEDAADADDAAAGPAGNSAAAAGPAGEAGEGEASGSEGSCDSGSEMDLGDFDDGDYLPSYEFRFETAKLLLELDDSVETASQVLEQLLEENDSDPNVWLLLAMCCQGGGDLEGALSAAEEGVKLCKRLKVPADDEMLAGFEAMRANLSTMLEAEVKEGGGGAQ